MWNQITLDVPDDLKDAVIGELSEDGVAGVWEYAADHSGTTRLVAYFDTPVDVDGIASRIHAIFSRGSHNAPEISRSPVEECDWTEEWRKSYTSFPVGESFFVIPSWVNSPCPDERLPIRIDPGQAFGTGTHETTQLTMEALERWVEPHHVVLDVGTGSGIVALASRLLGARQVIACDIDPIAVQVAKANILRNNEAELWTFCGSVDAVRDGCVHLLLGNLTADVIMELLPEFARILAPKGVAVFAGILNEQREDVLAKCGDSGFVIHEQIVRGEWLVLVSEKYGV
jgi:ribosomal protein L11 methyltransferase